MSVDSKLENIDQHQSYVEGKRLQEQIEQWQVKLVLNYWLDVHPVTHLPGRRDIDPVRIPKALPYISMTDVETNPFRLRFRLIGTAINNAFGRDFTGEYFDEAFPDYENALGYQQRKEVFETGLPIHYVGQGKLKYNLDYASIEWILLPLATDGENVDIVFAALSYGGL